MSEKEEFELQKKDYILKTLHHLKLLEELSYESFSEIGMKGTLANSRFESTTSYGKLILLTNKIKVKIG